MAGFVQRTMSYLGMTDASENEEMYDYEEEAQEDEPESFEDDTPYVSAPEAPVMNEPEYAKSASITPIRSQMSKIMTVQPKSYADAETVGRAVRNGIPVILNLTGATDAEARRIVDFSSGVVYGVRGRIEQVTPRVYILSPAQVELSQPGQD